MEHLKILIEGSGRHVHVSQADLEVLFGKGFELEKKKDLSQPGQFASFQKVDVVGPKGVLKGVSILGPCRKETQIELSYTDARVIGLTPKLRESGKLDGTDGCKLVGPAGTLELQKGVIVAKRHIHLCPETAAKYGLTDNEIVLVQTAGERALLFDEVVTRVSSSYADAMHVDYDEANAASLFGTVYGTVLKK